MITKVIKYDEELKGIININNNEYHIPSVFINEEIDISFSKDKKSVILNKIITPSKERITPKCSICHKCGGCSLQSINYKEQLRIKTNTVKDLFKTLNASNKVKDCIGMEYPFEYRNKNQFVIKNTKNKSNPIASGFYEEGTHNIINFDDCAIQNRLSNEITKTIKMLMQKMHYSAYDEDHKTGLFRHILIRNSETTKEIMVVIVTAKEDFPGSKNFSQALIQKHKEITTIVQNINTKQTSMVLGEKEKILYGKGFIIDELMGLKFKISSRSFYQINSKQCVKLYSEAINNAGLTTNDILLDAYSGVGTIGLIASRYVKKVISVELNKDAVSDAVNNAKYSNIKNVQFYCDDATKFINKLANQKEHIDVVIMDPPRKGSDQSFLNAVLKLSPKKIIYISCNPHTQVEDINHLEGYQITSIQPVDMFPQTFHVETVVCLSRKTTK